MMAETAFCTSCGAVVGEDWEFCEACGAKQPVEVSAIGLVTEKGADARPGHPASARPQPLARPGLHTPAATYLSLISGAFILAGIIYLFATAGFPPGITTTYEYHPDGTTSTSSSPDIVEAIVTVGLFLIGAVFMRASRAANSPVEK